MNSNTKIAVFLGLIGLLAITYVIVNKYILLEDRNINKVKIAWIGPLSGNAIILGQDNYLAIEMAIDDFNTKNKSPKIELKKYDDKYNTKISKKIYRDIQSSYKPHIIFLSTYEAMIQLDKLFWNDKVIVVNPIDNDIKLASLNKNTFLVAKRTEQLASIISQSMVSDKKKNTAILYFNSDSFMPTVATEIRTQFTKKGQISSLYPYRSNVSDFQKIISIDKLKNLDGIVLLGYAEMENAIKYIRKYNKKANLYSVNTALSLAANADLLPLIEGMRIPHFTKLDGNPEKAGEFLKAFHSKFGRFPKVDWIAFQAYDAINILNRSLYRVIKNSSNLTLNSKLREDLLKGELFEGVSGDISINTDGTSDGIYIGSYTIKNGKPIRNK